MVDMIERAPLLARTFVDVADTLVADFDVLDFLSTLADRCVELLDISDAGIMLAEPGGELRVAAASSHRMNLLELFELQHDDGPCVDSYRTSRQIRADHLENEIGRWPRFAPEAVAAGFTGGYGLPMRLRDSTIGSLNLLRANPGALTDDDLSIAQALADVATIGMLQHRAASENRLVAEQLQYALNSRVIIEQAKGMLSAHAGLEMDSSFAVLRQYARNNNRKLADVAEALVDRRLAPEVVRGAPSQAG
jgi:GAF domain-containing protein